MPTLSASDYTQYLKYKAAATSYTSGPPRQIQTTVQVSPNINIVNAFVKTSQASLVVAPSSSALTGLSSVIAVQPEKSNNPNALSTLSGSGTMSSSVIQRPGGLPSGFKGSQNTYTRLPQNAGWIQGNMVSSGPKRF